MSVYVDKLRNWGWRLGPSCHLIADTIPELHLFAAKLGLRLAWFQDKPSGKHYDLTRSKRELAVKYGAVELDDRPFHTILKQQRKTMNETKLVDSRIATYEHIQTVQKFLMLIVGNLTERAMIHDQSKLKSPEVEVFDEFTPKLAESTYGSNNSGD